MVHGETYVGDGDTRTRAARQEAEEEAITERTEALLAHPDNRNRDGYSTPCGDWIRADEVRTHAERCAECREVANA